MPRLIRITTVPLSLHLLLTGQMRYMREHGFEVLMISADGPEREAVIENEGCSHVIVPMTRAITPWQDLRCLWQLVKLFQREQPDIVHTHTPKAGLLGMLAAWWTDVPVVRIHTVAGLPLMTARGFKRQLLSWAERVTYAAAQQVWPNSRSLYEFILENGFVRPYKLDIVGKGSTNGIDLERYSPEVIREDRLGKIKSAINYDPGYTYLLAIGRVVRDKGVVELVEAFQELKKEKAALKLLLIGPLEQERAEESLPAATLDALRQDPDIQHIQWSDEIEYYLHLADLFIHASHREGFPNVVLQAGAMGCPVICSDIPGNIDIVTDRQTGLHFRTGATTELIRQLQYALDNAQAMKEMAERLQIDIQDNFRREEIHKELYKRYLDLLQ